MQELDSLGKLRAVKMKCCMLVSNRPLLAQPKIIKGTDSKGKNYKTEES